MNINKEGVIIKLRNKNPDLSNIEKQFLSFFGKDYLNNNISFQLEKDNILVFLRALDIERFKNKEANITPLLQELMFQIKSIGSYNIKSGKRFYVDINKEKKTINRKLKIEQRRIERKEVFDKKNNIFPEALKNKIICADSLEVLKKLPDNCIDIIFTSPPYNFGLNYLDSEDAVNWDKYFEFLFKIFNECIRVLKYEGRIIVNVQPLFSDYIPSHHIISNYFLKNGLLWKGEIIWEKNNYNCKYCSWGSWKSPSSPYLKYTWEFLEIFAKGNLKKNGKKEDIDIQAEEFKQWVLAKWSIAPERKMKEYNHPAMFPEELAKRVIKLFSYKNDIVLDPFNGVGTTTAVAKSLDRYFLGIDISKEYCKKACERINNKLF